MIYQIRFAVKRHTIRRWNRDLILASYKIATYVLKPNETHKKSISSKSNDCHTTQPHMQHQ